MIIGIDAREAAPPTPAQRMGAAGRARYAHELVRRFPALAPEMTFLLYTDGPRDLPAPPNAAWRPVHARGARWHVRVARDANHACDVYFSAMTYLTPQLLRTPYVQTIFDLIPFKDFALPHPRAAWIERVSLRRTVRRARRVIAISRATADDVAGLLPGAAPKITPIPLAADGRFRPDRDQRELDGARSRYGLPDRFVLAAGTIEPRKNLLRLVRAHGRLPRHVARETPLVLAGRRGWGWEPVLEEAGRLGAEVVRYVDFVPDEDLARLYSAATVFCYPSLYEGFGLPVLEAMQAGAPVITSNVSSLPEVGGDAVAYVDPLDEDDLTTVLGTLLDDERERARLRRAGIERAGQFSWETTAMATLDVLKAAAS